MKLGKAISAFVLGLVLIVSAGAQQNQPNGGSTPAAAPALVIDSLTHDFGEVKAGTPLRHIFKVKNQGKADLLINNVAPG